MPLSNQESDTADGLGFWIDASDAPGLSLFHIGWAVLVCGQIASHQFASPQYHPCVVPGGWASTDPANRNNLADTNNPYNPHDRLSQPPSIRTKTHH
jgi:hypothetical protein